MAKRRPLFGKIFSYPLVIETADRVFYLDSVKTDRERSWFYTPELVLRHLSEGIRKAEQIMRYLSSAVKDAGLIKELEGNIRAKTQYYISENISSSEADVNGRKVFLSDPSEFVHETMHILTLDENTAEGAYLAEGVAEFLSREICEIPSDINYRMYYSFIDDAPLYGSMKDFVYDVKTQFFSLGGTFADFDSFKFYLLEQAVARTTLSKPRYKLSIDFAYATMSINDVRRFPADFPGNDLTYPEAYLFVRYLIDNYGIDKVLACCLNYDFETFFNQIFDEAFVLFASSL